MKENELAGCSSGLIRLAKERQRSGPFKDLIIHYEDEEKEGKNSSSPEEWPKANPRGYYEIRGENTTVKGNQFAEMVLPVNTKEINPSLRDKIKLELRLLKEKLFG
jgi:hypothetical protein